MGIPQDSKHNNSAIWNALITDEIALGVSAFSRFLDNEYLPAAAKMPGIFKLKNGSACFFNAVTWWTTLNLPQDKIEAFFIERLQFNPVVPEKKNIMKFEHLLKKQHKRETSKA